MQQKIAEKQHIFPVPPVCGRVLQIIINVDQRRQLIKQLLPPIAVILRRIRQPILPVQGRLLSVQALRLHK